MIKPLLFITTIFIFLLSTQKVFSKKNIPAPSITVTASSGTITACQGTAAVSPDIQQFIITASGLTGNISISAPVNFEISFSPTVGYTNGFSVQEVGGQVAATTIYVRSSSSAPAGPVSGNVMLTTPGYNAIAYVNGTINALPVAGTAPNQSVFNTKLTTAVNFTGTGNYYTWVNNSPGIGLAASGSGNIPSFQAINTSNTPIVATITVTPESAGHAYVPNDYDGTVSVINTLTNAVETTIKVGSGPSGVACSLDGKFVYITNLSSGTVSVINTTGNTVINTFKAGSNPNGIAVSPDGSKLYVVNSYPPAGTSATVSVISTSTGNLITAIPVEFNPYAIVISPDGTKAYVTNPDEGSVSVINTQSYAVSFFYLNQILSGEAISPDGKLLYVVNDYSDRVHVVSTATNTIVANIPVGGQASEIAVSPDGTKAYVTNFLDHTVSVINTVTNLVTNTIPVGRYPFGVSVTSDGNQIYITNSSSNNVSVINARTNAVQNTVNVGSNPECVGSFITPGTGCSGQSITFTITVNPSVPTITATTVSGIISGCVGSPSASPGIAQLTVSGDFLSSGITAKATAGFEISLNAAGGYSSSLNLLQKGGVISGTVIYVRSTANAPAGQITGTLALTASGVIEQDIPLSGTVNALPAVNPVASQVVMGGQLTAPIDFSGTAASYNWINDTPSIGLPASGNGNIAAFNAVNNSNVQVKATIAVTPKHPALAYIANSTDNTVSIINGDNNQVVATIPVGKQPYGVAVSPDGLRGYVTNLEDQTVSVVDATAKTVIATISVGADPVGIAISPDGSMIYVANAESNTVSVISAVTNTLVKTMATNDYPTHTLVSPDGKLLYVANQYFADIWVFDTSTGEVLNKANFTGYPVEQMVNNADGSILYFPTLDNGGSVYKVDAKTFQVLSSLIVGFHGESIVLSPDGNLIYVPRAESGEVLVINTNTFSITQSIAVGPSPRGISITPDGKYIYVTGGDNNVAVINGSSNAILTNITVGQGPISIGSFISPGSTCDGVRQTFNITVNPTPKPFLNTTAVTGTISACEGKSSVSPDIEQFDLSSGNLTGNIVATASSGFEITTEPLTGYSSELSIPTNGGVFSGTIYVRSSAQANPGNTQGNVTLSSDGVAAQQVAVSETIAAIPTVNAVSNQSFVNSIPTAPIIFTGSADGYNWANDNTAIGLGSVGAGSLPSFNPVNNSAYPITANIVVTPFNSAGCTGVPFTFKITVNPTPTLIATGTLTGLTTVYGTASSAESFTISSSYLSSVVTITPPSGFEISTDERVYSNIITINSTETSFSSPVYIRLASTTPVGKYGQNIVINTDNTNIDVFMPLSTVSPAPLTITADNLMKPFGAVNPPLTVTYSGFVNNEGPAQLISKPILTTTALTQSPPGLYPVTVNDAASSNYSFIYISGILTIKPTLSALSIPNAFTPNGDGINDTWEIKNLAYFPKSTVNIFNRWGQKLFSSIGYPIPWNGTYNGTNLPSGTYYYIIDPKNGQAVFSGWLSIIR